MPRTKEAVLALCLVLAGSPLLASPGRQAQPRAAHAVSVSAGVVHQLWESLVVLWKAAGCIIDPDGARCVATTSGSIAPLAPADAGCIIDPNGFCVSQR